MLVGLFPKGTGLIWGYYALTFFLLFLGRMDMFPAWAVRVTPLGWVPLLPIDEPNWIVLSVMAAVGAGLAALGIWLYTKRDINAVTN